MHTPARTHTPKMMPATSKPAAAVISIWVYILVGIFIVCIWLLMMFVVCILLFALMRIIIFLMECAGVWLPQNGYILPMHHALRPHKK